MYFFYFAYHSPVLLFCDFHIFLAITFFGHSLQSVVSEGKNNALDVSFVRAPIGMDLDWQLIAKISPCHVTVLI